MNKKKNEGYAASKVLSPDLMMVVFSDGDKVTRLSMMNGTEHEMPNIDQFVETLIKATPSRQLIELRPDLLGMISETPVPAAIAGAAEEKAAPIPNLIQPELKLEHVRTLGVSTRRKGRVYTDADQNVVLEDGSSLAFRVLWLTREEGEIDLAELVELLPDEPHINHMKDATRHRLNRMISLGIVNRRYEHPDKRGGKIFYSASENVESVYPDANDIISPDAQKAVVTKRGVHEQV